mgnify:CR=1 FL=1
MGLCARATVMIKWRDAEKERLAAASNYVNELRAAAGEPSLAL